MKQPNNDVRHAFFGLFRRSARAASEGPAPATAGLPAALISQATPDLFALTLQYGCDAYWLCAQAEQGGPSTAQGTPEALPHIAR